MGRLRNFPNGLLILAALALVSCVYGVESDDYYESLKDDDEVRKSDVKESVTEYPNGVNVIPGEAEVHYPIYDKIPKSRFSCIGRPAGFYADTDLRCQVWHTCDERSVQQSFLCTNGTTYSQEKRVCDWWYNVNCDPEEVNRNYEQNRDLYKGPPPKAQDNSYDTASESNDIPSARKSSPQPHQRNSYDQQQQQQQQQQQRRPSASEDRPVERRPSENQYTEPEEYQQRQSQRDRNSGASQNNNRQDQRTTPRPSHLNGPQSQGTSVPEKKRVIVLRLPGPLPPGATIPPHVLREYAESVLAAERAGKTPPTGLAPRPSQPRQETPRPTTPAPQRPTQGPQRSSQGSPLPPIVSAPFKPVLPYTPRPFSQFLEAASKYNGQARGQKTSQPTESPTTQQSQTYRPVETRPSPQVEQKSSPSPSRQSYEEPRRSSPTPTRSSYEEPRRSPPTPSQDNHNERKQSEHQQRQPQHQNRQSENQYRQPESQTRQPETRNQQRQSESQNRQPENKIQHRQSEDQNRQSENQERQPQTQNRQPVNQYQQQEPQNRNRQPENQNRQPESRNRQPENEYRQPEEQSRQSGEHKSKPVPSNQGPYPEKKAAVKAPKAQAPPTDPYKKFRHSTPRKHVNVKFAPKGQSSFEENEDERQFPEESRRPAYPFQFNNFHNVPHHISSEQEVAKEDVHLKTAPAVQDKPRRRPKILKESFGEEEYRPTTVKTTQTPVEDPIVHRIVVVARQGLKIKDPQQETTTEKAQDFRRARYESVKVQNVQTTQGTQATTTKPNIISTTTPTSPTQTFPTSSAEDTPRTPNGTRRVIKVKKIRTSTTTQATLPTEDLGFDVYGRNPDEDEEEELIRAAQQYQEASEHYGKRRRPSQ